MRLLPLACVVLGLAACEQAPLPPITTAAGIPVTADPIRTAVLNASNFFARPQANQPAAAARAIADVEFLAATMPGDPRHQTANARGLAELQVARREARAALGVPAGSSSDAMVRGLRDAATALDANDRRAAEAALPREVFPLGPAQTIRRLAQPPRVPSARGALTALGRG